MEYHHASVTQCKPLKAHTTDSLRGCLLRVSEPFSLIEVLGSRIETTRQQALCKLFSCLLSFFIAYLFALSLLKRVKLGLGPATSHSDFYR